MPTRTRPRITLNQRPSDITRRITDRDIDAEIDRMESRIDTAPTIYNTIMPYSTKVPNILGDEIMYPVDGVTMGVELETETKRDQSVVEVAAHTATLLQYRFHPKLGRHPQFALMKHDASIQNGFEIVSLPFGLKHHMKIWEKFFRERSPHLKSWDTDRCGMHIHIGRQGLTFPKGQYHEEMSRNHNSRDVGYIYRATHSPGGILSTSPYWRSFHAFVNGIRTTHGESRMQLWKIYNFVNSAKNHQFIEIIAQRGLKGRYATTYARLGDRIAPGARLNGDRYSAVNFSNRDTIEFRIFSGTLKAASFYKNLEFIHSLVRFTRPGVVPYNQGDNVAAYFRFLIHEHKLYPNLTQFLAEKGFTVFMNLTKNTKQTKIVRL